MDIRFFFFVFYLVFIDFEHQCIKSIFLFRIQVLEYILLWCNILRLLISQHMNAHDGILNLITLICDVCFDTSNFLASQDFVNTNIRTKIMEIA